MLSVLLLAVALTGQAIETSTWDTVYGDEAGTYAVPAELSFRGDSGTYRPRGKACGVLSDVSYSPSPIDGVTFVSGRWSYAGKRGWFSFDVIPAAGQYPSRLRGYWGSNLYPNPSWPTGYWISRGEPR